MYHLTFDIIINQKGQYQAKNIGQGLMQGVTCINYHSLHIHRRQLLGKLLQLPFAQEFIKIVVNKVVRIQLQQRFTNKR